MKTTRYYATFTYLGSFVSESSTHEIPDPFNVQMPKGAFAFKTFARTVTVIDGEELLGPPRDHSPETIRGEEYTLERVRQEMPNERILIANMEGNHWPSVVRTTSGRFVNVSDGAIIVSPEGSDVV